MNNSIQNIEELPSIDEVKKISQGLALVDAIIMPEWEFRYFSFNGNWDGKGSEKMASMRDGSGEEYFLHFSDVGMVGKVFSGDSLENVPLILSNVPDSFSAFKSEVAFSLDRATFFLWQKYEEKGWRVLPENLHSYSLLKFFTEGYSAYVEWAEEYYEKSIIKSVVKEIFTSLVVTSDQISKLNPDITFEELKEDIQEILGR